MTAVLLFDGDLIRASVFNPGQPKLFVSFRQRIADPGSFAEPKPVRSFINQGMTHLHLQSRLNDWYINSETAALEGVLTEFAARFDQACAMGFSMGGYAAFRFAAALRLGRIIAVSPQYSIAPEHVPFDRRYRDCAGGFALDAGDLGPRGTKVAGVILADPFRPLDIRNAALIQTAFPAMRLARLAGGGHPATGVLGEGGKFAKLQAQLVKPVVPVRRVVMLHRNSRRKSVKYWQHLAKQAEKFGRLPLARHAEDRASMLLHQAD
ncbi:alpha/beta hydrolase [Marinovum sp. 2_MG-2023]|uniref:alpha/beta hydrolase n=1 Tax=unclassified Marinovum TaxID=2647166 RepID=UPI0026E144AD|nr:MULTISPECIES: alpha/beta hydrolase [unclassified Marinovum]MDO6731325.1 alpha/beta hydrolase [Marinovum sp. 2_MG-2023]MDO6780776.1 alpha/beta hydrolase [Marinovum sp. 1_MG-2023]